MEVLKNGRQFLEAEVAGSFLRKARGLMFREIDGNEGLLMVFDGSGKHGIWMPFVPQDLSIIFIDSDKEVIDKTLAKKITVNPKTWRVYRPSEPCSYIIECGATKMDEVEIGDSLEWEKRWTKKH